MPAITPLMLNGVAYAYRDIRYGGLPGLRQLRPYVRAINFTNASDGALNHGHSPLGRKVSGAYSPTLDFELAEEGVESFTGCCLRRASISSRSGCLS